MTQQDAKRPVYPTWIRSRRIVVFWLVALGTLALGAVAGLFWLPGLAVALLAIPFLYIAIILTCVSHRLGPRGGDLQRRIHQLLIASVGSEGRLLDVGCGSGQLLIRLAKSAPGEYVGLDYWGDDWEYSLSQAEHNAEREDVQGLQFLQGSASRLPFADGDFRRVVSCLTFHEVRDVADTTVSIAEALRVLDLDGRFAFIDLFDDPGFYDGREQVLKVIESAGGKIESTASLSKLLDLRFPLTLGKVLKYAVLVSGVKTLMEQRGMPPGQRLTASTESRATAGDG